MMNKQLRKYRYVLTALVVVLLPLICGCGQKATDETAATTETIELKYANFPPMSTFPCVQMEQWKNEVEKRTDGQVKIKMFPGSTLLNPKNMFSGVMSGMSDIGCFAMSYLPGRFPVSEAVDQPLGFNNAEEASLTLYDLITERKPEEFKDVKIITMFTCPPAGFMTSMPVESLADLAGMQLRCSGTGSEVIKRLGANPVAMPMSSTPEAIQRGTVKGIVSSLEVLKDMNFAAYCKNATEMKDLYVVTFAVIMNQDKYDALPDDVKKVIDDMARPHARWTGQYADQHVQDALEWAQKEHNLQVHEFTPQDQAQVSEKLAPMIDEYKTRVSEAGIDGADVLTQMYAIRDKVREEISD
jgi:TRAP-type C4-dicarboxylate transport system substrate-binding protein